MQGAFGNQMSWQGFAAGAVGSLVGSGIEAGGTSLGMSKGLVDATQIAGWAALGGAMADDFWQGFTTSAIVGAANHAMKHGLSGKPGYHKVKDGETLKDIADKYGVSVQQLKKWNRLDELDPEEMANTNVVIDKQKYGERLIVSKQAYKINKAKFDNIRLNSTMRGIRDGLFGNTNGNLGQVLCH